MQIQVSNSQHRFLISPSVYRAFVGGYGSGKTFVGCLDQVLFMLKYPKRVSGYFGLTHTAIRDIYHPTLQEVIVRINDSCTEGNPNLSAKFVTAGEKNEAIISSGKELLGVVKMRSLTNPEQIVGFQIMQALIDELDVLSADKARIAWQKILARLRVVLPNGEKCRASVVTTPEGFKFVYETFVKSATPSYDCIHASTYENATNLSSGYIELLHETYPPELVNAYVNGQFCNLTSGVVYYGYNRTKHQCNTMITPKEPLYVGMDFNVGKMAASLGVLRGGELHLVGEIYNQLDTPTMIRALKTRFPNTSITVYPDASGGNRSTHAASETDLTLLKNAGFSLVVPNANGFVRDRILATNNAFDKMRVYVNSATAPKIAESFEQQSYDAGGEPDKQSGSDHQNDASTYLISRMFPLIRPVSFGTYSAR